MDAVMDLEMHSQTIMGDRLLARIVRAPNSWATARRSLLRAVCIAGPPARWFRHPPKTVKGHFGCVNAAAFSKHNGALLATGGDDSRVLIWSTYSNLNTEPWTPVTAFDGHTLNIFCIEFDRSGRHVFSTGADGYVLRYDLEHTSPIPSTSLQPQPGKPETTIFAHEDAILKLSIDPTNDNVFMTASQDGRIRLWDLRAPHNTASSRYANVSASQLQAEMRHKASFNYVEFNPTLPHLFVSCDNKSGIFLHDLRSFSAAKTTARIGSHWSNDITHSHVIKYTTRLFRNGNISRPADITSSVWSPDGAHMCASIQRWYPTIYALSDPHPLYVLKTDSNQGQNYKSLATIKTPCFSTSLGTDFVFAGSDDFSAYGWRMIDASSIVTDTSRQGFSDTHDMDQSLVRRMYPPGVQENQNDMHFYCKGARVRPVEISAADIALRGHRSIINTVAAHPALPYIVTAGVEKCVRIFTPGDIYQSNHDENDRNSDDLNASDGRSSRNQRARQSTTPQNEHLHMERVTRAQPDPTDEDPETIMYFDNLMTEHELLGQHDQWRPVSRVSGNATRSDMDENGYCDQVDESESDWESESSS